MPYTDPIAEQDAAARDEQGWIEWGGGECPVSKDTLVAYRLRGGVCGTANANDIFWRHGFSDGDLVAYKVVSSLVGKTCLGEDQFEDPVNFPKHYASGDIECIDAIKAALTPEEFRGYLKGSIMKYVWRERRKGGAESLRKADWFLGKLLSL